jgi:hypothetical protein
MMRQNLGQALPPVMEKVYAKDPALFADHLRGKAFAQPEDGALDGLTRAGAEGCARAMTHRAKALGVPKEAILETAHIARFAVAGRALEAMEPMFDEL